MRLSLPRSPALLGSHPLQSLLSPELESHDGHLQDWLLACPLFNLEKKQEEQKKHHLWPLTTPQTRRTQALKSKLPILALITCLTPAFFLKTMPMPQNLALYVLALFPGHESLT